MPNAFAVSLHLQPRVSRLLQLFVACCHGLTFGVIAYLVLRQPWAGLLCAPVVFSLWWYWRQVSLHGRAVICRVVSHADGSCEWWDGAGRRWRGQAEPSSIVLSWLVIMHLRAHGGRKAQIVLLPDSLPTDEFRRLRVRLRVMRSNRPANGPLRG